MSGGGASGVPLGRIVALAATGAVMAVIILAVIAANARLSSAGSQPPPELPPLTDLPPGRALDWSWAGYRDGKEALPTPAAKYNVADFGARRDGMHDDTSALQDAVAAANADAEGGVVFLPPGTYLLNNTLAVTGSNIVIRGAGAESTTIYIPISLADLFPGTWSVNADGAVSSKWLASGAFISFMGSRQRSSDRSKLLANIQGPVELGATVVPVDSARKFKMGQRVRIWINDGAAPTEPPFGGSEDFDDWGLEEGPADAAAGTAALNPTNSRPVGMASAQNGSLAWWIYGDGLADAGQPGAVGRDAVSFSARVTSIGGADSSGPGWIALDRPLPFPVLASWKGVVATHALAMQDSGIEHLTIKFKHTPAAPHFQDRGYNAIEVDHVSNCWVRQVNILNADNGVLLGRVDHSTITDVNVGVTEPRFAPGTKEFNGHHAISITQGHGNLLTRFNVSARYHHDVTVASGALLNVISEGGGLDMNIDLHRAGAFGNLFTQLHMGQGTRPFSSGGRSGRGAHSGRLNTFWNLGAPPRPPLPPRPPPQPAQPLTAAPPLLPPPASPASSLLIRRLLQHRPLADPPWRPHQQLGQQQQWQQQRRQLSEADLPSTLFLPECDYGPMLNFVGGFTGPQCKPKDWLVQGLGEDAPSNLHLSQVTQRRSAVSSWGSS